MRPPHHPPTSMTITKPLKMASINALLLSQSMHALVHGPDYYLSLLPLPLPPSIISPSPSPLPPPQCYRLLQDQHVYQVSDCSLGLENTSVVVEVTSFEPLQELLITWELKVLQSNYVVSGGLAPYPIDRASVLIRY